MKLTDATVKIKVIFTIHSDDGQPDDVLTQEYDEISDVILHMISMQAMIGEKMKQKIQKKMKNDNI